MRPRHKVRRQLADKNTLTGRASRALGWSFGSTVLTKISMLGIGIMLARLLGPHAFGTYAVAYVALMALLNFNELGVSLAIVRWPDDPAGIIPTVTTISIVVSLIIYIGCFLAAPAYASAMGAPASTTVVRVLALAVLSDGLTNTPVAVLQRNFRQGQRTIADQINVWLGTGVTVALAWSGYGAMSLAIGRLVGGTSGAILLLSFAPESLRLGFDLAKARALLRFGLPLAGANLLTLAVISVDQVIVGHELGPVELGFYALALNLAGWPLGMFFQPVRTVGPAVFSRLQHDRGALSITFLSAAGLLCAVAMPACLLIGGAATPLISVVYGIRWLPAAQPLLWLALLAAVQVFFLIAYDFFVVLARSRFLFVTQLTWLAALVPALLVGASVGGIRGAAVAEFAVAAICILPCYLVELSKSGIPLRALSTQLWLPLAGAAFSGLLAWGTAKVAASNFVALAASGVASIAVVGLLVYRMRASLALLRATPGDSVPARHPDPVATSLASAANVPVADIAEDLPEMCRVIDTLPAQFGDEAYRRRPSADSLLPRSSYHSQTGPRPSYRSILELPASRRDLSVTSPLYRITVASLRWDPFIAQVEEDEETA
jgi:PST family polysaccharide transporter